MADLPFDSEDFWQDVRNIARLSSAEREYVAQLMEDQEGFFDLETFRTKLKERIADEVVLSSVVRLAVFLELRLTKSEEDANEFIPELEAAIRSVSVDKLDPADLEAFCDFLRHWTKEHPAIQRSFKAEQLFSVIGHKLEDFQVICDLRPVFDEARSVIEGMFPVAMMHIVLEQPDGRSDQITLRLTPQQIGDIYRKMELANQKLGVLGDFMNSSKVPHPKISSSD